ncbi:MAG: hypothetical protein CMN28_12735 [Salinisphaeraceae bacterium]|nr:hypothetical protein [Salinisphaeraceae bacterium]
MKPELAMSRSTSQSRSRGNTLIIAALVGLFGYVCMGFGPFSADSYDSKGAPIHVQHYGSSSDYRFIGY